MFKASVSWRYHRGKYGLYFEHEPAQQGEDPWAMEYSISTQCLNHRYGSREHDVATNCRCFCTPASGIVHGRSPAVVGFRKGYQSYRSLRVQQCYSVFCVIKVTQTVLGSSICWRHKGNLLEMETSIELSHSQLILNSKKEGAANSSPDNVIRQHRVRRRSFPQIAPSSFSTHTDQGD